MRSPEDKSKDLTLMQGVASGSEQSIADLYDRFASLVYRMAYQAMPTREEANDAVQEVFIRLWKTADRFDPERAALVTWVLLITRRHLVDRMRRAHARIKPVGLSEEISPAMIPARESENLEQDERFEMLMARIASLPELQRTVVVRAYLGGQTLRQIADELHTPIGTIKSALSRALVRLRERVGTQETLR